MAKIVALEAERSKATNEARSPPALVRRAAKSECPSGRSVTASPSIKALGDGKPRTASQSWKPVGESARRTAPYLDALALLSGEDSEAVVLHLMKPAWPGGREGDEGWPTRLDETGRRSAPKTLGSMPRHASVMWDGRWRS